ncbi:phage tail protein [Undibacterium sp. Di27W]|uniref:phage tail tape measure protein n=1 Tax=Undibacterium sp. Di27W TaxID=3413036 RepID=UPI003BF432E9
MSERDLKLQVVFNMIERVTAPLKRIIGESTASGKALKALRDKLKDLDAQQKHIAGFRQMHTGLRETGGRLDAARLKVKELAEQMAATEKPTRTMTRELNRATTAARLIKQQHQQESQQLQVLRDKLNAAGISTSNLTGHDRSLRNSIASTNSQIDAQKLKLAELAKRHEHVSAAKAHMEKTRATGSNMVSSGMGMTMTGAAMSVPLVKGVSESKHYETEVQRLKGLGMSAHDSNDAVKFAAEMKTFGTSQTENLELMRDALSVFGDLHHAEMVTPLLAKMKFLNATLYDEGEAGQKNEAFMDMLKVIELRGGLASKERFEHEANMVQKVIAATGGRVGSNEWLNFIKTGGLAAKALDDKAFFYQMEPLIQEMGGNRVGTALQSAYQNLYQGKTTNRAASELMRLGLVDKNKVIYDKVGNVNEVKEKALVEGELFKANPFEWIEKVLLPKLAAHGITEKSQIEDTIGTIMTNRTGSGLYATVVNQMAQIKKNAHNNERAADIDTGLGLAIDSAKGREIAALKKLHDLQLEIGNKVLPIYASALEIVADKLQSVVNVMKEYPGVTKTAVIGLGALAGLVSVLGVVAIVVGSILGPFAIMRFLLRSLGIAAASNGAKVGLFARAWQWLASAFARIGPFFTRVGAWLRGLGPAIRAAGSGFMWLMRSLVLVGRSFLLNPIVLAIATIAGAAYLIYRNWAQVSAFFSGLWASIKQSFDNGVAALSGFISAWNPVERFRNAIASVYGFFTMELPTKFSEFGSYMMQGLVNGITSAAATVRETISNMADNVVSWFKEKLGIHSPSVVFAELGQFTMQGLAIGIDKAQALPLDKLNGVTRQMTAISAGVALGMSGAAMTPAFAQLPPPLFNQQPAALVQFAALPQPQQSTQLQATSKWPIPQQTSQAAPLKFDRRPPVAPQANTPGSSYHSADTIQIVINPPAGSDPQAIAKAVAAELDRRERQKSQAKRSAMHDYDEF